MTIALIVLHAAPEADNPRADTAVRLAGAMLAEGKEVRLFLAGQGIGLLAPAREFAKSTRALFLELLDLGLTVQCCGTSLKKPGMGRVFTRRCYKKFHEGSVRLDQRRG
ncbi:hypothetical protein GGI1_03261 [Acidithiobacillus sp. GGI-221]|nr:hypothetical protein GGI1_03261 [Acidithiobacillus sp. GGI-221]